MSCPVAPVGPLPRNCHFVRTGNRMVVPSYKVFLINYMFFNRGYIFLMMVDLTLVLTFSVKNFCSRNYHYRYGTGLFSQRCGFGSYSH